MCITIVTLFTCACRSTKTVLPCPMMDTALDLVDLDGVPESDPRVQRLEDQCDDKAATRYEMQPDVCAPCRAAIEGVGWQTWRVAKDARDRDFERAWMREVEREDDSLVVEVLRRSEERRKERRRARGRRSKRVADMLLDSTADQNAKSGNANAMMGVMSFLRDDDDDVGGGSPSAFGAQIQKETIPSSENKFTIYLDASDDGAETVDTGDLGNAVRDVLVNDAHMRDSYAEGNIYDADDGMLDVQHGADGEVNRSAAPSPGRDR